MDLDPRVRSQRVTLGCCTVPGRECVLTAASVCACIFFPEYSLSSAELSSLQGFSSPGLSLGSMSAWQQHQLGQAGALSSLV